MIWKNGNVRTCCLLLSFFITSSLMASTQEVTKQIVNLINAQEYQQAYTLALENQFELEGEPEFDYAFALAAKANSHLNQAVFALERVLQNKPNLVEARLVLGACYFELGNLNAAEEEFEKLLDHEQLNQAMQASATSYLGAITALKKRQEQRWMASASFGAGYDSNANNGVADEFIDIPSLGTFTLFQESLENTSAYVDIEGTLAYVKPVNQHTTMQFSASLVHAEFQDEFAFDRTFAATSAGVQSKFGEYDFSGSVFYRPLWLDGDILLNYYGASTTLSRPVIETLSTGVDLAYSQEDFQDQQGFDRDLVLVKVWLQSNNKSGIHKLSLQVGEENSSDSRHFLDRELLGIGYQWQKQLHRNWQAGVAFDYLDSEYQGINALFDAIREDQFISGEVDVKYAHSANTKFLGRITYLSNDSEIPIYEYQRFKFWLGATYEF